MNFVKQLNTFFDLLLINPLNPHSQCLYLTLLYINYRCNGTKAFSVANSILMSFTNLSVSQLNRARNNLIQRKLIRYTKGKNQRHIGIYEILELETVSNIDIMTTVTAGVKASVTAEMQKEKRTKKENILFNNTNSSNINNKYTNSTVTKGDRINIENIEQVDNSRVNRVSINNIERRKKEMQK